MTVKERLIKYLEYKKISKSDFGKEIGVSSAYVTSMRKSIQPDKIESIALKYPDLDTEWLLTGKGSMLKKDSSDLDIGGSNKPLSINDLVKAINNLSEAAIINANAAMKNAEANERYSKNMERMLDMISGDNIPYQKRDVQPKSPGINDAAETA
jgi:hypothetical protein